MKDTLLVEVAWEICHQVGGIYTVIRSKLPAITEKLPENYLVIGPYLGDQALNEFDYATSYLDPVGKLVKKMQARGLDIKYGHWHVSGRPRAILMNPFCVFDQLAEIKYLLSIDHGIPFNCHDQLLDETLAFGHLVFLFLQELSSALEDQRIIAHFHEWMSAMPIPKLRKLGSPIKLVFTTHATILGRYLASFDPDYYQHLGSFDWRFEAQHFNCEGQIYLERAAAHGANVFTTVSEVTARECQEFLGRWPDVITPNGLNLERFTAAHEFQNLHQQYKEKIHRFVMGHFFPSYSFDLDRTLYFFTSGRFEFRNKGFDITLEALVRLNWLLQKNNVNVTVVMFFVTPRPYHFINPQVLHARALLEELHATCNEIKTQIGERLFYQAALSADAALPALNNFVDEHLRLKFRRLMRSWKQPGLPFLVTHSLVDSESDPLLSYLKTSNLLNNAYDRVKVVYHPDFINLLNPLFLMDYDNFVRGCHLGIFPSYYEPWGYTPLECIARGVPTITSNLAGFGDYALKNINDCEGKGILVADRVGHRYHDSATEIAEKMFQVATLDRRGRIKLRNLTENVAGHFDWKNLSKKYFEAYQRCF